MSPDTNLRLEVLHVPDCPNLAPMLDRLREVTDLPVTTQEITTDADAATYGMAGSPTLLINGADPFSTPDQCDCGVSCRLYRDEDDRLVPVPSTAQLRHALTTAEGASPATVAVDAPSEIEPVQPGDVLSAWRTRALPMDPAEKAAHQAILRCFAATGHPPTAGELDPVTSGTGRTVGEVLAALHHLDAIRLAPDGHIALAYPFSATPTRHRVRIADHTDVYAMCAIDALGMSAMLGQDTHIDSVDTTTGQPITVTTTAGQTRWEPAGAVVFIGADSGGGPSADCCCDYLNFFADHTTAQAWTAAHPQIPGQILTQEQAEDLGTQLFGQLLAS